VEQEGKATRHPESIRGGPGKSKKKEEPTSDHGAKTIELGKEAKLLFEKT